MASLMRSVEAVNGVMFTVLFPITFLANAFAPTILRSLGITAVIAPFALRAYARRTSD